MDGCFQNKKRKYDRDDREEREKSAEEPPEDPLKNATTLYVGNLLACSITLDLNIEADFDISGPSIQLKNRYTSYFQSAVRSKGSLWAWIGSTRLPAAFALWSIILTRMHWTA